MKKKLLALAVAGAMVAPLTAQADAKLYGSLRVSVQHTDQTGSPKNWDVRDEVSRFGFKGSNDLGNGLKGTYKAEIGIDVDDGTLDTATAATRPVWAGIKGGFGEVRLGRQWSPYFQVYSSQGLIISNSFVASDKHLGRTASSVSPNGVATGGIHRVADAVKYISPNMSGFNVQALVTMDGNGVGSNKKGVDSTQLVGKYKNGPLAINAGYWDDAVNDTSNIALFGSYKFGNTKVGLHYETRDEGGTTADSDAYSLTLRHKIGNNNLGIGFGEVDRDGTASDVEYITLALHHKLSKKSLVFVEYESKDYNTNTNDIDKLNVGIKYNW